MDAKPNEQHATDGRLRIVHVVPWDALGGVESAAREMAKRENLPFDFKVLLLAKRPMAGDHPRMIPSRYQSFNNPLAHWRAFQTLLREKPDLIICSLWRSVPATLAAKLFLRRSKLIAFVHNETVANIFDRAAYWLAMLCADAIWFDSHATLRARIDPRRASARVISFVLSRLEPVQAADRPVRAHFVSWGRMTHQKGVDRALHLIALLAQRGIDVRYELWGPDNGLQAGLESLRDELGLADRVTFKGPTTRSSLPDIASNHSFYLQLSRREGMAMAVVESMQLGLVPVVTPVGEMANYCRPGTNALLCDVDHMEYTADALAKLLSDPEAYRRMSVSAREYWERAPLYPDDVADAAVRLYAS